MHISERINEYACELKKKEYIYHIQRMGIESFIEYIKSNALDIEENYFDEKFVERILLYWIPKNKKYITEVDAYQLVYTMQDIYNYIISKQLQTGNKWSALLEKYAKEYMRACKVKNMLLKLTKDPVIGIHPFIIDLNRYKEIKKKEAYCEIATTYEQALFSVQECKEEGQIILKKLKGNKKYKLLLEYPVYQYLKTGDLLQATIKRKLFYVYWELEEIKSYYLPQALSFLC